MNQNQTESKPLSVEEPRDEGSDETICSRNLRERLLDVIQKFRDEEEYLLLEKSSRALGGAIAYGDMANQLSKLVTMPDDDTQRMKALLARIAYPSRGTPDETASIDVFAAEIQAAWSLGSLTENVQEHAPPLLKSDCAETEELHGGCCVSSCSFSSSLEGAS
jgi:hypothetical protein